MSLARTLTSTRALMFFSSLSFSRRLGAAGAAGASCCAWQATAKRLRPLEGRGLNAAPDRAALRACFEAAADNCIAGVAVRCWRASGGESAQGWRPLANPFGGDQVEEREIKK